MADTIQLTCSNCGSTMDVTPDREFIFCQYCGAKQLVNESDEVRIEKVRQGTLKDIELSKQQAELERSKLKVKQQTDLENRRLEIEHQKGSKKRLYFIAIILLVFSILCLTLMSITYIGLYIIPGFVFLIVGLITLFVAIFKKSK